MTRLHGLGPKKVSALHDWGVENVLDLVQRYPRRYIDRTKKVDLADLAVGDEAVVLAEVRQVRTRRVRRGRPIVELSVRDATGGMQVVFFNQPWRAKQLVAGAEVLFFGKLKLNKYNDARQMENPLVDLLVATGSDHDEPRAERRRMLRIIPVYPASAKVGLTSWEVGIWVDEAIRRLPELADPLPSEWRTRFSLIDRTTALRGVHLPDSLEEVTPAQRRLAFDELFRLQLALALRRRALERDAKAIRHAVSPADAARSASSTPDARGSLVSRFLSDLPFSLTASQRRALEEIFTDMAGPLPAHRLLQGDVGSGKTVVALSALLAAVQGRHQGALMVPTEVLAEQHFAVVRQLTEDVSIADESRLGGRRQLQIALLTSRTAAGERAKVAEGLRRGEVDIVVGTHALLTDDVQFRSLGLAVIDEQHRFGVDQRAALREKGRSSVTAQAAGDPDLLLMTATPIPRTAAMVVFGDLDMTVLDELPPGRGQVATVWARTQDQQAAAWEKLRAEVAAGRRAYVVCPLVEGSDRLVARSAVEEHARLSADVLPGLRLGLLHGQMSASEKELTMDRFRSGETQVLVATTVIEVGVDVPEATVMVVEDAERFGIAQLHQLRGRVGRGGEPGWCYLLGEAGTPEATKRLAAIERTTDGFALAEEDLALRGAGTILGTRQKGASDLQLASLRLHRDLLDPARQAAVSITEADPALAHLPLLRDELSLFLDDEEAAYLFRS